MPTTNQIKLVSGAIHTFDRGLKVEKGMFAYLTMNGIVTGIEFTAAIMGDHSPIAVISNEDHSIFENQPHLPDPRKHTQSLNYFQDAVVDYCKISHLRIGKNEPTAVTVRKFLTIVTQNPDKIVFLIDGVLEIKNKE